MIKPNKLVRKIQLKIKKSYQKTIKSSFVIFILKVNDWSNKKKLKEAKTIVGKEPIFKNKSIKLKIIRMIGSWNDGDIMTGSAFLGLVLNIASSK